MTQVSAAEMKALLWSAPAWRAAVKKLYVQVLIAIAIASVERVAVLKLWAGRRECSGWRNALSADWRWRRCCIFAGDVGRSKESRIGICAVERGVGSEKSQLRRLVSSGSITRSIFRVASRAKASAGKIPTVAARRCA